jgi:hypothetical protein
MPESIYGDLPQVPTIEQPGERIINPIHGEHTNVPAEATAEVREEAQEVVGAYFDSNGDPVPLGIG